MSIFNLTSIPRRRRTEFKSKDTGLSAYTFLASQGRTSITLGARDRVVRRTPNSIELRNNFKVYFDLIGDADIETYVEWAELLESGSSDLYPLERVETMRLHVYRRGKTAPFETIWFRNVADAELFADNFPAYREQYEQKKMHVEAAEKWRKRDLNSRLADALEDEGNDPRLGALSGSEKQIAWAGDIRRAYLERGGNDAGVIGNRSAKWWIDNRYTI